MAQICQPTVSYQHMENYCLYNNLPVKSLFFQSSSFPVFHFLQEDQEQVQNHKSTTFLYSNRLHFQMRSSVARAIWSGKLGIQKLSGSWPLIELYFGLHTNGRYTPDTAKKLKSVAKNILKTGIPPKKVLSSWEGETRQQKTDSTVTKKCS